MSFDLMRVSFFLDCDWLGHLHTVLKCIFTSGDQLSIKLYIRPSFKTIGYTFTSGYHFRLDFFSTTDVKTD